jgi:hypothetical protein
LAGVGIAVALALVGCGNGDGPPIRVPAIPEAVVPASLESAGLTIHANRSDEIDEAFASVGPRSLVVDGQLWEIRQGDRLVGALELASLEPRADTRKAKDREAIHGILPTEPAELDFFGTPVYQAKDGAFSIYLWFGRQLFGVLQLKGDLDPDVVADELITIVLQDERWPGLPPEVFEEEEEET